MSGVDIGLRTSPLARLLPVRTALSERGENLILDCTRSARFGLRGPGTLEWMETTSLAVPKTVNSTLTLPCGTGILRLGSQEVLLTAGTERSRLRELREAWRNSPLPAKGYDAYRDEGWAWFLVSGEAAPLLMSRISMADLRPQSITVGQIVQTRALHQDAVIARLDRFGTVSYDIFLDIASSDFVWEVLSDTASNIDAGFQLAQFMMSAEQPQA